MQENFQVIFNIIFISFIVIVGLLFSYNSKIKKATSDKDKRNALAETFGAGVVLAFILVVIFITSANIE